MKKIVLRIRDYIVTYSKYVFPVLLIAVVAVTVSIALGARDRSDSMVEAFETSSSTESAMESESIGETDESSGEEGVIQDVLYAPLELNAYPELWTLICTYYNALGVGDPDAVEEICNQVEEMERIKIQELGNYIESYPVVEVYSKSGPVDGSYIVFAYTKAKFKGFAEEVAGIQTFYVCTDEEGKLYLNEGEVTQEELDYIQEVVQQDDVIELSNKTSVEYSETMVANPELFEYIVQMEKEIRTNTGLIIAQQQGSQAGDGTQAGDGSQTGDGAQTGEGTQTGDGAQTGEGTQTEEPQQPEVIEIVYGTATTTVNVRASASTTADRIGSLSKGLQVKILEEMANGWSRVEFEGAEGYIKSEYLKKTVVTQNGEADTNKVIGTVTATTNVRIRELPSTDSNTLGSFVEGRQLELLAVENGWCKVLYDGKVAYVSEKYVTKKIN